MEATEAQLLATAEHALGQWDIAVQDIALVSRSENVVFKVQSAGGQAYALRVHRPGYNTLAELESEIVWAEALNASGTHVPAHVRAKHGGYYARVVLDGTQQEANVGLIEWKPGARLAELIEAADPQALLEHFASLGRIIAAVHDQATGWQPPTGFVRRRWDAEALVGDAPLWGRFWEAPQLDRAASELLQQARRRILDLLTAYGEPPDEFSLIHADLHPRNVLVDGANVQVIDFDDCGFGWHLYDIAVALWDYREREAFAAIQDSLIAGYRESRKLAEAALQLLPAFYAARSLISLGWINARPELMTERVHEYAEATCAHARRFLDEH